jgi:hypothetical protein
MYEDQNNYILDPLTNNGYDDVSAPGLDFTGIV